MPAGLPTRETVEAELRLLREKGPLRMTELRLPALGEIARWATADDALDTAAAVDVALRRAVAQLGGGPYGEAAAALFGLDKGTRVLTAGVRRGVAASKLGVGVTTFRKRREARMLSQVAAQLLAEAAERKLSSTRLSPESREPAESALALHWIERFTPTTACGPPRRASRTT